MRLSLSVLAIVGLAAASAPVTLTPQAAPSATLASVPTPTGSLTMPTSGAVQASLSSLASAVSAKSSSLSSAAASSATQSPTVTTVTAMPGVDTAMTCLKVPTEAATFGFLHGIHALEQQLECWVSRQAARMSAGSSASVGPCYMTFNISSASSASQSTTAPSASSSAAPSSAAPLSAAASLSSAAPLSSTAAANVPQPK